MENYTVCILYTIVPIVNFLNANKQITVAEKRKIEKTDKTHQPRHVKYALILKQKSKNIFVKSNLKDALL